MAFPASTYWQLTLFFKNADASGFSESYYTRQADNPDPTALISDMLTKRKTILNENTELFTMRISDPGKYRDIILPTIGSPFGPGLVAGQPMAYESAFLFRLQFAENNVRPRAFHGFTEGDMDTVSQFIAAGPTTNTAVNAWFAWLIGTYKLCLFNQTATVRYPAPFTNHLLQTFQYFHFRQHDLGRPFGLRRGRASPAA